MSEAIDVHTADEVADVIKWAAAEQEPLELVSGGTKRGFGHAVAVDTLVHQLNLSGLSGITLYEPEELVVTVKPGTPLSELEQALATKGQQLAFEPPDWGPLYGVPAGGSTIGGIVACNLSGSRRFASGAARDHVLGLSCVSGRGEEFKCGGRVVKNVTGYDLCKVLTGSYGTLAALTEITLRVVPAPEHAATVLVSEFDDGMGVAAMGAALSSPAGVSGAAHMPLRIGKEHEPSVTALRLEGPKPSVEERLRMLRELDLLDNQKITVLDSDASVKFWREIRDIEPFADDSIGVLWRLSLPPAQSAQMIRQVSGQIDAKWFYDWGGSLVWLAVTESADGGETVIRGAMAEVGGHATLVCGTDDIKAQVPVFQPQPSALTSLSNRIKNAFDPRNILNPGRMAKDG